MFEDIGNLIHGFAVVLQPFNLLLMVVGIVLGVIVGVLPGLGGANGVAILLPLTFSMSPTSAIIMLSCIYWGALFGGAITSILFNIPGEPWSVATTFDGYPMAQQGRAGEALTAAFTSSFVGALFAVIMITLVAPLVAGFALRFGPAEIFSVYFLAFCSFVGLSKEPPFKTVASMMLGFALGAVGLDQMTGQLRLTFGVESLLTGFDFLIAVIGLFGIGEILLTMEEGLSFRGKAAKINLKIVFQTWKELPRYWMLSLRSCLIGCWMGISPAGATPASFMSYGIAKRISKRGHNFGKGEIEGVIAPETAAHAAGTSALLPMISLGVPGSPTAAVLLGGLLIWGLQPGPLLVHRAEGLRLGSDRQHVYGQHRRPVDRAHLRALVRCHPAHSVQRHCAGHSGVLRDRCLHRAQQHVRRGDDVGVRRRRLFHEEVQLPLGSDGAGDRSWRQGRGGFPPVTARLAREPRRVLVEWFGQYDHDSRADRAVLAHHSGRLGTGAGSSCRSTGGGIITQSRQ